MSTIALCAIEILFFFYLKLKLIFPLFFVWEEKSFFMQLIWVVWLVIVLQHLLSVIIFFCSFFCPLVDQIIFQYFIYWLCLQLQFVFYSFYLIFCLNLWLLCWSYLKVILYGRFFWDSFHWGGDVHSLEYWLKILCSNFLWNFSLIHKCRFNDFCSKNYFKWIKEWEGTQ